MLRPNITTIEGIINTGAFIIKAMEPPNTNKTPLKIINKSKESDYPIEEISFESLWTILAVLLCLFWKKGSSLFSKIPYIF